MRELLIRLIYCEMLGVECSWGYIHAVKMTQSSNIMDKRIGAPYLLEAGGIDIFGYHGDSSLAYIVVCLFVYLLHVVVLTLWWCEVVTRVMWGGN